jgi:hypothetical protein
MSTTIAGIVKNGVVVPSAPLPEGANVEIHLNDRPRRIPPELPEELAASQPGSANPLALEPAGMSASVQPTATTSALPPDDTAQRARTNQRRIELINKELDVGLTPAEAAELQQLQAAIDLYLQTHLPLPMDVLQQLQDAARREGLLNDLLGQ